MKKLNSDSIAMKIAQALLFMQQLFARRMSCHVMKYSKKTLKILTVLFSVFLFATFAFLFIGGFYSSNVKVSAPQYLRMPVALKEQRTIPVIDRTLYHRLHSSRLLLDSIRLHSIGYSAEDSFILSHPGFYDSLLDAEKIIQSPRNK